MGPRGWAADPNVNLQFGADGKFKIVQFTDLHWEWWQTNNSLTVDAMKSVLDQETPDMVVLTGDVVPTELATLARWREFVEPMQSRGIPWAVTLGNHDVESYRYTPRELVTTLSQWPNSLVELGPTNIGGASNQVFTIKDSTGQQDAIGIYCMDSQVSGFDSNQIQWYRDQSAAMTAANGGAPLPSLAFFHIPLPEFNYYGTSMVNGQIGQKGETVVSNQQTGEMFTAIGDMGDVMGVFVGHDHWNDYALFFDEVCLAYGRKTGQNGYGTYPRGGRVIELTEGIPGFDSWIRDKDGTVTYSFHYQRLSDSGTPPVPEPSSLAMLLAGLAACVLLRRRLTAS